MKLRDVLLGMVAALDANDADQYWKLFEVFAQAHQQTIDELEKEKPDGRE